MTPEDSEIWQKTSSFSLSDEQSVKIKIINQTSTDPAHICRGLVVDFSRLLIELFILVCRCTLNVVSVRHCYYANVNLINSNHIASGCVIVFLEVNSITLTVNGFRKGADQYQAID